MKQPLPFDEDNYLLENDLSTGFIDLSSPSWVVENTTGGGAIDYTPHYGGRARLDSGTTSVGDRAEFTLVDGDSDGYSLNTSVVDLYVLSLQVEVADRNNRPSIEFGFHRDLGDNNTIMANLQDETMTVGTQTVNIPKGMIWEDAIPYSLVWDNLNQEVYCVGAGVKSQTVDAEAAGVSTGTYYNVRMPRIETTDTTFNNEVIVRSLSLRTYQYW